MIEDESAVEARYQNRFGRIAGYLPPNRAALDAWLDNLKREVAAAQQKGELKATSGVTALADLIRRDGITRMYVQEMIDQVPLQYKKITSIDEMLNSLNYISHTAPLYNPNKDLRNFFPMSTLFTYMMMTTAGEAAFRYVAFNNAIRVILQEWCDFLDSPISRYVLNTGEFGWLSPSAYVYNKLDEFVIPDKNAPHWGFASFNAYFHRQIKPERRPIDEPNNPKVIVSANDGTVYAIARNVKALDRFWIKGQPYSLINVLDNQYVDRFVGGDVFQAFLSGADYHRWHAPVAGIVRAARIVEALMFSDAESAGFDPTAGTYSQGYEASVNTRALVFIESPDPKIGLVCVIPTGITEISSVSLEVKAGDAVKKGDELGYFSYGGSTLALVFQPGAIDHFTVRPPPPGGNSDDGQPIKVNAKIAVAR